MSDDKPVQVGKRIPGGQGIASVLLKRGSELALAWDARRKSRFEATDSKGRALDVRLADGTVLRGGDVLVAEDGSLVRVVAAAQPVLVVTHCTDHGTPLDLLRAAYHLGSRHVPLELQSDRLLLEPDHALADRLRDRHLIVTEGTSAFEPENDAWGAGGGHAHGHDHSHDHDHGHAHGHGHGHAHGDHDHGHAHGKHDHAHAHDHGHATKHAGKAVAIPVVGQAAPHVHGPDCDHDHDHDHGHGQHGHGKKHSH